MVISWSVAVHLPIFFRVDSPMLCLCGIHSNTGKIIKYITMAKHNNSHIGTQFHNKLICLYLQTFSEEIVYLPVGQKLIVRVGSQWVLCHQQLVATGQSPWLYCCYFSATNLWCISTILQNCVVEKCALMSDIKQLFEIIANAIIQIITLQFFYFCYFVPTNKF